MRVTQTSAQVWEHLDGMDSGAPEGNTAAHSGVQRRILVAAVFERLMNSRMQPGKQRAPSEPAGESRGARNDPERRTACGDEGGPSILIEQLPAGRRAAIAAVHRCAGARLVDNSTHMSI
eukprot:COSAG04_NODE_3190_length_3070_cov_1.758667_5_plen_120_part_00